MMDSTPPTLLGDNVNGSVFEKFISIFSGFCPTEEAVTTSSSTTNTNKNEDDESSFTSMEERQESFQGQDDDQFQLIAPQPQNEPIIVTEDVVVSSPPAVHNNRSISETKIVREKNERKGKGTTTNIIWRCFRCNSKKSVKSQVLTIAPGNNEQTIRQDSDEETKKIETSTSSEKNLNDLVYDDNDHDTNDTNDIKTDNERKDDDEINLDLEEATCNLPDPETWKYRPVFIQRAGDTKCPGYDNLNESLPIGTPFEFETKLFKGRALLRLRNGKSDDEISSKAYFDASEFKLMRQLVIQGRFKHKTKMSDVWIGDVYDKKFKITPPPYVARFISKLFHRLAPGVIIDMVSDQPKVVALIGSGSHTISVDKPGDEPDVMAPELPENTPLGNDMKSAEKRKQILGRPETASSYEFDPDLVYTFHTNDEALDLGEYKFRIPILTIDFTRVLGDGQPMSFRAIHGDFDDPNPKSYFYFRIWHERTLIKTREAKRKKRK